METKEKFGISKRDIINQLKNSVRNLSTKQAKKRDFFIKQLDSLKDEDVKFEEHNISYFTSFVEVDITAEGGTDDFTRTIHTQYSPDWKFIFFSAETLDLAREFVELIREDLGVYLNFTCEFGASKNLKEFKKSQNWNSEMQRRLAWHGAKEYFQNLNLRVKSARANKFSYTQILEKSKEEEKLCKIFIEFKDKKGKPVLIHCGYIVPDVNNGGYCLKRVNINIPKQPAGPLSILLSVLGLGACVASAVIGHSMTFTIISGILLILSMIIPVKTIKNLSSLGSIVVALLNIFSII